MGLYLGAEKFKLNYGGVPVIMNIASTVPMTNGIKLISSEGYILKDLNGVYLTVEEGD